MGNIVHTMTNRRYAEACVVSGSGVLALLKCVLGCGSREAPTAGKLALRRGVRGACSYVGQAVVGASWVRCCHIATRGS